ncbi:hypothetical protein HZ326_28633 [Fusarium oxysporum f. sp. albedinis]|nr:hypothetical protein HZ326_28633 [Fusarium oxysporum f. sp. albedinis]
MWCLGATSAAGRRETAARHCAKPKTSKTERPSPSTRPSSRHQHSIQFKLSPAKRYIATAAYASTRQS